MAPRTIVTSLAGLLLLCGCGGSAPAASSAVSRSAAAGTHSLYLNLLDQGWQLTRLDWTTLRDVSTPAGLRGSGQLVVSADGSTLADLQAGRSVAVAIIDAATGAVRRRYNVDSSAGQAELSADGSRLALADGSSAALVWRLSDTRSGRVLHRLEVTDAEGEMWNRGLTMGFRFLTPGSGPSALRPTNPIVTKDDPARGREVARLTLEDVYAGTWKSDRPPVDSEPVVNGWQPGVAISPSGGMMAVVYADGDRLALVDLSRMRIQSTVTVQRQLSWIERLGPHVRDVQAKGMDGWLWSASFAPDGNLLAWGQNVHETDQGQFTWDGLGLRLIDPTTGTILEQGLDGLSVDQVLATPDGRAIIATATRQQGPEALYRLDPHTLAVQASRQFSGNVYPQPLILARP